MRTGNRFSFTGHSGCKTPVEAREPAAVAKQERSPTYKTGKQCPGRPNFGQKYYLCIGKNLQTQ